MARGSWPRCHCSSSCGAAWHLPAAPGDAAEGHSHAGPEEASPGLVHMAASPLRPASSKQAPGLWAGSPREGLAWAQPGQPPSMQAPVLSCEAAVPE